MRVPLDNLGMLLFALAESGDFGVALCKLLTKLSVARQDRLAHLDGHDKI